MPTQETPTRNGLVDLTVLKARGGQFSVTIPKHKLHQKLDELVGKGWTYEEKRQCPNSIYPSIVIYHANATASTGCNDWVWKPSKDRFYGTIVFLKVSDFATP